LKVPQIAFRSEIESLPACAVTPLIINVGDPPTEYFSLSALWILNSGYRPFSHESLFSRFAITSNSLSVAVVHVSRAALSMFSESRHPSPSPAVKKQVK